MTTNLRQIAADLGTGNSVRPYEGSTLVCETLSEITQGLLDGARLRVAIWSGNASDGYKSEFTSRPVFWVLLTVETVDGVVVWGAGARTVNRAKALGQYQAAVGNMHIDVHDGFLLLAWWAARFRSQRETS